MDCREFQRIHPDMLDETIEPVVLVEAHRHMLECESCANQDTSIRRALLVFRNLKPIKPSAQFSARLNRRLAESHVEPASWRQKLPLMSACVAAGFAVVFVVSDKMQSRSELSLPPVITMAPETTMSPLVTPALAASLSAGLPVWPAFLMAEQASQQLADAELKFATFRPR